MSKGIAIVFQNRSNYNYYFIMTELEKEFKIFRSNKKKIQKANKNQKEITKTISYKLLCINSMRFIASSLLLKEFIKINRYSYIDIIIKI